MMDKSKDIIVKTSTNTQYVLYSNGLFQDEIIQSLSTVFEKVNGVGQIHLFSQVLIIYSLRK